MPIVARTMPVTIAAAAALVGLLAVVNPLLAVAGSVGIAFGVLMLADLGIGLALFAFAVSLFEAIPEFADFSVAKAIGLALAVSWLAALTVRGTTRGELFAERAGYTVLLLLLATWSVASVLWAEDSAATQSGAVRLVLNLLLIPIAFAAVKDTRTLRLLIGALLAGILVSVAYGLIFAPASLQADGRLEGAGLDPNYLSVWLIATAVLAVGLLGRRSTELAVRWVVLGCVAVCVIAALATASRTGLVAMAAVLAATPLLAGHRRRGLAMVLVTIVVASAGFYFASFAPGAVRDHVTDTRSGGSGRTDIWKVGLRMATANPVLGVGLGNFQTSSVHYLLEPGTISRSDYIVDEPKVAHNTYLELFAEIGVVGLALFVAIVLTSLWSATSAARLLERAGRRDEELMARAVALAIIAVAAGSAFISIEYTKPLWLLLALGPVSLNLARRRPPSTA